MKPHLVSAAHVKYPPRHTKDIFEFFDETGMKQWGKVRLVPAGKSGWYLADFMIYKKYRGKGLASMLMECVLKLAKRKKKKSIFLWVEQDNTPAIKVYEKYGFKRVVDDKVCMFLLLLDSK
jgi:ribosomal protein S18 acetylase RimI-like enzyme